MRKPVGLIRLHALPAPDVWHAQGALTLYAVEPRSTVTVTLDAAGLRPGAVAGLALFSSVASTSARQRRSRTAVAPHTPFAGRVHRPYAWLGIERDSKGFALAQFVEQSGEASRMPLRDRRVWLRADCDFVRNEAGFHYSTDGRRFASLGDPHPLDAGPATAQSLWCSLFSCATAVRAEGGHADFDSFVLTTERVPAGQATEEG